MPDAAPKPRSQLPRLLGYLRPYRGQIALGLVCLILATPAQLFHPLVWMFIVDEVIMHRRVHLLWPAVGVMVAVQLLGMALSALRTYVLGVAGQRFVFDLRNDVYDRLQSHSLAFFHHRRSGDLVARAINDVDALQEVAINGVDQVVNNLLQFVAVGGILLWLQWKLGILTLAPMIAVAVVVWGFNARIRGLYRAIRDRLGDLSAKLQENLTGILVIKAFAREPHERERFGEGSRRYLRESVRGVVARTFYMPSVMSLGFLSSVLALGFGAIFVLRGEFTVGGLVAYRGYWWQLFSPVMSVAQINEMVQRAIAAASRVFELLDAPVEITDKPGAQELTHARGRLACEGVTFGYGPPPGAPAVAAVAGAKAGSDGVPASEDRGPVLRDVWLEVRPGQRLGLVGPSGAGKSTLLALFLRLYDPQAGRVLLDGHDLRDLTQLSLRRHFAVVTQEPFLFNDTLRANILYGRLDATEAEVIAAAKQANAHEFIEALPKGYDTLVGERGVRLSGGQKQRVSIARAFLANPPVLLLDEATAAVEPESETIIQHALARLLEGRTGVIVSHRLSMVRDADLIAVVAEGGTAERGTHEELLARGGWYARMYRMQMGMEAGEARPIAEVNRPSAVQTSPKT